MIWTKIMYWKSPNWVMTLTAIVLGFSTALALAFPGLIWPFFIIGIFGLIAARDFAYDYRWLKVKPGSVESRRHPSWTDEAEK